MTLKKMTLFAGMVVAAIAFAAPAMASGTATDGTHWTDDHEPIIGVVNYEASFEGFLDFTIPFQPFPVHSTFGCEVTIKIKVTDPTAAKVTQFTPTTTTCVGTGVYVGCKLDTHTSNVPWDITNTTGNTAIGTPSDFDITKAGGDVTIRNVYKECPVGAVPSSDPEFKSLTVTPTIDAATTTITKLTISGKDTTGVATATGSIAPEPNAATFGLETVEIHD